jgi:hypothetical protein
MSEVIAINKTELQNHLHNEFFNMTYSHRFHTDAMYRHCMIEFWDTFKKVVDMQPTVKLTISTIANWDKPSEHGLPYATNKLGVVCSRCCKWSDNKYDFCPNCGANMMEVEK